MKNEQLNHKLAEVELINPYEKDSEAYANWDFGNSIIGLARAIKELEEEYEEYDKIYHNPKLTKYGSEEERELHDKLWALDCNLCVLRARIKEKEYAGMQKSKIIAEIKKRLDDAIDFPQLDRKRTEGVYIYQELIKVKLLEMLKP